MHPLDATSGQDVPVILRCREGAPVWRTTVGVPAARWHRIMLACFLDFFACELIHINYIVLAFAAGEKLERGSHEPFLVDFQKRQVLAPMLLCAVNALGGGEGEHGTILKQEPLPESFATG
jgi:hypothetical protein